MRVNAGPSCSMEIVPSPSIGALFAASMRARSRRVAQSAGHFCIADAFGGLTSARAAAAKESAIKIAKERMIQIVLRRWEQILDRDRVARRRGRDLANRADRAVK